MPPPRRVWCSCTIIDWLKGEERARACIDILSDGERGQLEIVVSTFAIAGVGRTERSDSAVEARIKEFFGRDYVIPVNVDILVAEKAQELVRKYPLSGADAVHLATAIVHRIPILETFDGRLLNVSEREGDPTVRVRHPHYDGVRQTPLL